MMRIKIFGWIISIHREVPMPRTTLTKKDGYSRLGMENIEQVWLHLDRAREYAGRAWHDFDEILWSDQ